MINIAVWSNMNHEEVQWSYLCVNYLALWDLLH